MCTCIQHCNTNNTRARPAPRCAGHHLDLMFSHTGDPASVVAVREHELAAIQDWVAAFNDAYAHTIA